MSRKCDTKERLLEAALELIWESSYAATSVDSICAAANVKKGSFYYFFASKSELAIAALEASCKEKKPLLDALFSPTTPPLQRLSGYFDYVLERQTKLKEVRGCVLGCPLFSVGCEISTRDEAIRMKVRELLDYTVKYFESAIRDAHAEGVIDAPDALFKANILFAMYQGSLTQARIQNSLEPIRDLHRSAFLWLRASESALVAA